METPTSEEQKNNEPLHFRQEVIINGLPYVFEGDIPKDPENFEWQIGVSNWEDQKPGSEAMITSGVVNPNYVRDLAAHHLGNGKVGVLQVKRVTPPDNNLSIGLEHIQTETNYLPEEFGYNQAEGIGSFLLDNLCALADSKKWRIYLQPDDRGGRLTQGPLVKWYRRRGFDASFRFGNETRVTFGDMQRQPKEPNPSHVVSTILQTAANRQ